MELKEFYKSLKEQEDKYGVEINVSPDVIRDAEHLDCLWYGGEIGSITYKGYHIVIGAYGDITLGGLINGREIHFRDRNNMGEAFYEIGDRINDKKLYELLNSSDVNNYLLFENNNWFEVDLIDYNGNWIDLSGKDNVLSNNLLDCFEDVGNYFEYVDMEINKSLDKWGLNESNKFRYQMLSRLISDCKYYLGNGNHHAKYLWAENEKEQIEVMKLLYNSFSKEAKPEWISMDDIDQFEKEMVYERCLSNKTKEAENFKNNSNNKFSEKEQKLELKDL